MQINPDESAGFVGVSDLELMTLDALDVRPPVEGHLAATLTDVPGEMANRRSHVPEPTAEARVLRFVGTLCVYSLCIGVINDGH